MQRTPSKLLSKAWVWILAAVVFLVYCANITTSFGPGSKAQIATARTQIANFVEATQLYVHDNGRPPSTVQGLEALIRRPVREPLPKHWKKYMPDLEMLPNDPWDHPYIYQSPGPSGEPFLITSYGADGKPGGRDLDTDITSHVSH